MIDLRFTQNPEWIAERENKWDGIKEDYSDGYSRKQREKFHHYFLTGQLINSKDIYFTQLFELFPLQSLDAHEYIFKSLFNAEKWSNKEIEYFSRDVVLKGNLYEDHEKIIRFYLGDSYDPNRKIPFLVKDEKENRAFNPDPYNLILHMMRPITYWLKRWSEDEDYCIGVVLLDYIFSLIKTQTEEYFGRVISDNPSKDIPWDERQEIKKVIARRLNFSEFLRAVSVTSILHDRNIDSVNEKKGIKAKEIFARLDNMRSPEYCSELIDHWQWVKRRSFIYELTFDVGSDMADSFFSAFYYFRTCYSLVTVTEHFLPVIEDLDHFKILIEQTRLDHDFMIENYEYHDESQKGRVYFSCVTREIAENIRSIFELCPLSNLEMVNLVKDST
ncbi:hypothetical protein [Cellvibrio sp. NN19]|uniref:hypothetical protein n=1 Tax=Cellvibrio chitinivorans TaxID=3102792 RepID=UPI002B40E61F|nr:hypothetical protein [Cellvibrio sp. NN19]